MGSKLTKTQKLKQMTVSMKYKTATSETASSSLEMAKELGSKPVVVSAEAEALSHSKTTMKLTPSFDMFQLLSEEEGGHIPFSTAGTTGEHCCCTDHGHSP